jgi:N-acetylglucosamine kinase-like BadF-type ATPase
VTLVVGVDGGGTHTRAVIADERGVELGRAESVGAVVRAEAPGAAAKAVSEAVHAAAEKAGVQLPVDRMWAGLAGAGLRAGRLAVERELGAAGLAQRVVVGTDGEAAFFDAFGDGPGVLLISGTGSIVWARNSSGGVVRVGGWGERLGDEGSGFAIGMSALRAVARGEDGRGPATALRRLVLEHLSLDGPEGLISWTALASKGDVAALVPLVSRAASEADPVAMSILDVAVSDLGAHLGTALHRTGPWPEPPELVLWGGLLSRGGPLRGPMIQAAGAYAVRIGTRQVDPAMGAVKMALASLAEARSDS